MPVFYLYIVKIERDPQRRIFDEETGNFIEQPPVSQASTKARPLGGAGSRRVSREERHAQPLRGGVDIEQPGPRIVGRQGNLGEADDIPPEPPGVAPDVRLIGEGERDAFRIGQGDDLPVERLRAPQNAAPRATDRPRRCHLSAAAERRYLPPWCVLTRWLRTSPRIRHPRAHPPTSIIAPRSEMFCGSR